MKIFSYGYSDTGGRSMNEDTYIIYQDKSGLCAAVADGLGGHGRGKDASSIAAEALRRCYTGKSLPTQESILNAMQRANRDILSYRENTYQMKTTAVCLYTFSGKAVWAHIGDSRLYHFYNFSLVDYTLDHSVSQLAVELGEIKRRDIQGHSERNRLLRVIGDDQISPDFGYTVLREGFHAFLLCSDGLWEYLSDDEILMDLHKSSSPKDWIENLRYRLCMRADKDNDNNSAAAIFLMI